MIAPINIGQVLAGKYCVERVLGAGGMGIVVAAMHMHLGERVAIKLLRSESLDEPNLITRFLREARAAAKIRSEHVARVYDVGTLENGAPYLVMEHLHGSDLAALVERNGPLPVALAVEYILQACEALAEAHAAGIIHRDIKPANLFVTTRSDGSPLVKVLDFGISKITSGVDAGINITKTEEMKGSLLFMSPEQMRKPHSVDVRSDIWSLGVTMYNLITGSYPFEAETGPQLCWLVFQGDPAPLNVKRSDVPARLEASILRCLRKDPEQRYANVAELAAAIVDLAPPHARISAERAFRTLQAAGPLNHAGIQSASSLAPLSSTTGALPGPSEPAPPEGLAAGDAQPAQIASPPGTMLAQTVRSSWGSTRPLAGKRVGPLVSLVGIATVLVVAAAAGGSALLRRGSQDPNSRVDRVALASGAQLPVMPVLVEPASIVRTPSPESLAATSPELLPSTAKVVTSDAPTSESDAGAADSQSSASKKVKSASSVPTHSKKRATPVRSTSPGGLFSEPL